jgi:DNA-binding MarR family transcriptional regulator
MSNSLPKLDPLMHSELRLGVMSVLIAGEVADFNYLKDKTGASSGNMSVQINKLKAAGYIEVNKSFVNNYPKTTCKITKKGIEAFEKYVSNIKAYLK